jgi:hypothetical protein
LLFSENSLSRHRLVTVSQTLKNLVTTRSPFRVLRQHSLCQERLHQPTEIFSDNLSKSRSYFLQLTRGIGTKVCPDFLTVLWTLLKSGTNRTA